MKKLTVREKKMNTQVKKKLQEEGKIPPDKPKLNRKKFITETRDEWNNREKDIFSWELYLVEAFSFMLCHVEKKDFRRFSLEAVGAAKVLKLALRLRQFSEKLTSEGRNQYTITEKIQFIKDILDA